MADLIKIRARLQALRNMTVENGCTEHEALAAAEKAAELLTSHNLTEIDLNAELYDDLAVELGGRRGPLDKLWPFVALFAECRGWLVRSNGRWQYIYFGRSPDVLVAEYIHEVLRRTCTSALNEFRSSDDYRRRRTPRTRSNAVKAFLEGLVSSLQRKLIEGLWRRLPATSESSSRDLIASRLAPVDAALAIREMKFRTARPVQKAKGHVRKSSLAAGLKAGSTIEISAGVTGTGSTIIAGLLT